MELIEAIILKTLDYKDSSKILYLYTEKGLTSVIAHGVKKMNSPHRFLSQSGTLIKIVMSKGSFPSLKESELINEFANTKSDVIAYTYQSHILELVNHVIDQENDHPKMYRFLKRLLHLFEKGIDPEILTYIFELKLLHFIGYGLHFKQCTICQKDDDLVFSISDGGLICRSHMNPQFSYFESDVYHIIYELYYCDIDSKITDSIEKVDRITIRHILDQLYEEFVGYHTKSRQILKQIQKY